MEENKDREHLEEKQVIQEQIVPKKKNRWKKFGKSLFRISIYGVTFGVFAGLTLVLTGNFLINKLGLGRVFRQVVGIGTVTQAPTVTDTSPLTKAPTPPKGGASVDTPTPPGITATAPDKTPGVTVTIDGNHLESGAMSPITDETVQSFLEMYSGIAELSGTLEKSLVQITAITEGVDWFEEAYETTGIATGLYVGDNGLDMLFLVNLDSIEGATKFNVTFSNGETLPCSVFSYDTNYRLAVVSVHLSAVAHMEKEMLPEKATFALDEVKVGAPVMVLGNPNGHPGAMELGMITGASQVVQVTDDEVPYFTTGITEYAEGDGFVYNLSGEVIGMVSRSLNSGEQGVITAASVNGMKDIIEKTLNNIPRIYCGMRLETVDVVTGGKYKLPEGVYVAEVLMGSPAMYAGIKNGDIITNVGITPVTGVRQFYEEISSVGAQSVRVLVNRDIKGERKEQTLFMTPETRMH